MKILHHPDRDNIHLTTVLSALSDPIRLRLVCELAVSGEQSCGSFQYEIAKSTMTHHVRTLRESGVIYVRVQGTQHFLSLRANELEIRFPGLLTAILHAPKAGGNG
ncbi:ArsR/SmtB family transcription factor [Paenibacillus pinihumi]|uniref:ArsR/SmtB family transcription factor n=1 Tax=Paenibacillus pinihumi TaxID=669462 RepID=UPI000427CA21|nr:helix-turn-helix transcriptional regulator [Paenibacillus pinihumi]